MTIWQNGERVLLSYQLESMANEHQKQKEPKHFEYPMENIVLFLHMAQNYVELFVKESLKIDRIIKDIYIHTCKSQECTSDSFSVSVHYKSQALHAYE